MDSAAMTGGDRRRFLRLCGGAAAMAGGIQFLSGCDDDIVGAESVPTPPRASATPPPPTYDATDLDRINFALQLQYLLAAYLQGGVDGTMLPASLTSGSGTAGSVAGTSRVTFTDQAVAMQVREARNEAMLQLAWLRGLLGTAATAQPAINLAGGVGSPFQEISVVPPAANATPTPAPVVFNPYASQADFLLGVIALTDIVASTLVDIAVYVGQAYSGSMFGLLGAAGARDGAMRAALSDLAVTEAALPQAQRPAQTLFQRSNTMAERRNFFVGRGLSGGLGGAGGPQILARDADFNGRRRTPELALNVLYASRVPVSSGAFFPAGVNGLIRSSGSNAT